MVPGGTRTKYLPSPARAGHTRTVSHSPEWSPTPIKVKLRRTVCWYVLDSGLVGYQWRSRSAASRSSCLDLKFLYPDTSYASLLSKNGRSSSPLPGRVLPDLVLPAAARVVAPRARPRGLRAKIGLPLLAAARSGAAALRDASRAPPTAAGVVASIAALVGLIISPVHRPLVAIPRVRLRRRHRRDEGKAQDCPRRFFICQRSVNRRR